MLDWQPSSIGNRIADATQRAGAPCSDAQGIIEYRVEIAERFGAFAWPRHIQRAKFPVFSLERRKSLDKSHDAIVVPGNPDPR